MGALLGAQMHVACDHRQHAFAGGARVVDRDREIGISPITAIVLEVTAPHRIRFSTQSQRAVVGQEDKLFCLSRINQLAQSRRRVLE